MILKLILKHATSNRTAMIENDSTISYKQLYEKAFQLSNIISATLSDRHLSATSNCVVAIFLPNSIHFVISFIAAMLAGKPISPLNDTLTQQEALTLIQQSDIALILTTANKRLFFESIIKRLPSGALQVLYIDEITFDSLANTRVAAYYKKDNTLNKNSVFLLLPTSGTTGNAKIVALSQKNVYTSVKGYHKKLAAKKHHYLTNRLLILTPYSSSYGIMILLWSLLSKTLFIIYNNLFSFNDVCQLIETHKITSYEGGAIFLL